MSVKKLNNNQLVKKYQTLMDERLGLSRQINQAKLAIEDRIVKSECKEIITQTKRITIQYITGDRMRPIKELEAEFGEEWIDENRRRLQKTVESKKIKIEPLE